ncbi:uncharacterized protein LOC103743711 isoform X2 [Nannospalax galili]|uniref:uncharacterized protein LOC103743711 isoform X2 n=1 Tax=Nannospalax galili TaxID=1026970 RepID=UPI00111C586C|nr:uncharacterized protein LOC103743711 isoform X2 [Nannospalax galili]
MGKKPSVDALPSVGVSSSQRTPTSIGSVALCTQPSSLQAVPTDSLVPTPLCTQPSSLQGLQRRLLTAAPSELRLSLVSLLVRGMTVLEAVMEIQTIADVGLLWRQSQPGRTKLMLGPNPTRKDLLGWLLSRGVPREQVDKQPTKVLLELYIKEAKRSRGHPTYGLAEEQPPPPPYSDQACGEEPPVQHE